MRAIFAPIYLSLGISLLFVGEAVAGTTERIDVATLNRISTVDQFGKNHRFSFPTRKPVLVTTAGQRGSRDIEPWIRPIGESFYGKVEIVGVAQLKGVPASLRGPLRKLFAMQSASHPVLLDWSGELCEVFPYTKSGVSVALLDQRGTIVWQATGKANAAKLKELRQTLQAMVR
ncbi:MAG: hypothetical protein AAGH89_00540 [Verrucomicrobiota bacterium]